jgi:NAD(P)H-dependent flavin oxidoreductase YrpB (nitropropane dioxygenase family)
MTELATRLPLVAAPMAGGASTPALVRAATTAGAFAFLPGGYKTPEALATEIAELKAAQVSFGVNLFKVDPVPISPERYAAYAAECQPEADPYGLSLAEVALAEDDDAWEAKLAVLLADPVAWVSTTFGMPSAAEVAALHAVGTRVAVTVTTPLEAVRSEKLGVDLLVVQGEDAGGHSGTFEPAREPRGQSTPELVRMVAAQTALPLIAGGGVDGPAAVRAILAEGAEAVVVGTLLLRSDESGASRTHQDALADPRFTHTVITRAFTGRPARGLHNGFIARHEAGAPLGYPAVHHLTAGLRRAAAAAGDPDRVHLWSGTGFRAARTGPAAQILSSLVAGL